MRRFLSTVSFKMQFHRLKTASMRRRDDLTWWRIVRETLNYTLCSQIVSLSHSLTKNGTLNVTRQKNVTLKSYQPLSLISSDAYGVDAPLAGGV